MKKYVKIFKLKGKVNPLELAKELKEQIGINLALFEKGGVQQGHVNCAYTADGNTIVELWFYDFEKDTTFGKLRKANLDLEKYKKIKNLLKKKGGETIVREHLKRFILHSKNLPKKLKRFKIKRGEKYGPHPTRFKDKKSLS